MNETDITFVRDFYRNGTRQGEDIFYSLLKETNTLSREFLRAKLVFCLTCETNDLQIVQIQKVLFSLLNSSGVLNTVLSDEIIAHLRWNFERSHNNLLS